MSFYLSNVWPSQPTQNILAFYKSSHRIKHILTIWRDISPRNESLVTSLSSNPTRSSRRSINLVRFWNTPSGIIVIPGLRFRMSVVKSDGRSRVVRSVIPLLSKFLETATLFPTKNWQVKRKKNPGLDISIFRVEFRWLLTEQGLLVNRCGRYYTPFWLIWGKSKWVNTIILCCCCRHCLWVELLNTA